MEERLLSIVWMRGDAQGRGNLKYTRSSQCLLDNRRDGDGGGRREVREETEQGDRRSRVRRQQDQSLTTGLKTALRTSGLTPHSHSL